MYSMPQNTKMTAAEASSPPLAVAKTALGKNGLQRNVGIRFSIQRDSESVRLSPAEYHIQVLMRA